MRILIFAIIYDYHHTLFYYPSIWEQWWWQGYMFLI